MTIETNGTSALAIREEEAINRVAFLTNIVRSLKDGMFKDGVDYGKIPGTGDKPTLLLPGMEKLLRALRLRPEYILKSNHEDFDKPLFHYRYECRLFEIETGYCVSTAIGQANSMESKWRYRKVARVCPQCGKEAIIKGKAEYGGGWLCFKKKDGCGAKFKDNDPVITDQPEGRVENEDIFDQINTIDKIAQKRALSSAIKGAANVSEFFTVDLEDMVPYRNSAGLNIIDADFTVIDTPPESPQTPAQPISEERATKPPKAPQNGTRPGSVQDFNDSDTDLAPENGGSTQLTPDPLKTERAVIYKIEPKTDKNGKRYLKVYSNRGNFTERSRKLFQEAGHCGPDDWMQVGRHYDVNIKVDVVMDYLDGYYRLSAVDPVEGPTNSDEPAEVRSAQYTTAKLDVTQHIILSAAGIKPEHEIKIPYSQYKELCADSRYTGAIGSVPFGTQLVFGNYDLPDLIVGYTADIFDTNRVPVSIRPNEDIPF